MIKNQEETINNLVLEKEKMNEYLKEVETELKKIGSSLIKDIFSLAKTMLELFIYIYTYTLKMNED